MKKMLTMLAVAAIPAAAGGCNCCGLGACPCNPCNWFNQGAACAPTPMYAPVAATACPPSMAPAIMPQYAAPAAAPFAGAPMIADPSAYGYAQAQPMYYSEPGCAYVEPGCAYPTMVGYGPAMPMSYGGCEAGCCDTGSYSGEVMTTPVEPFVEPTPTE